MIEFGRNASGPVASQRRRCVPSSLDRCLSKVPKGRWPTLRAISSVKWSERLTHFQDDDLICGSSSTDASPTARLGKSRDSVDWSPSVEGLPKLAGCAWRPQNVAHLAERKVIRGGHHCDCRVRTIYRLALADKFPKRRQLSENSVSWLESDISEWIDSRAVARLRAAT
jgi:predicted DNA-binding transcriptional regulator AlpA